MTQNTTAHYAGFFAKQPARIAAVQRESFAFAVAFGLVIVLLLSMLRSPPEVWSYVAAVIGFLFIHGVLGLRRSATIAAESTTHLATISEFLADDPGRDEIRNKLNELARPDDNSNVPEALSGLLEGTASSSATVHAVARSAFGHAISAVGFAAFMRTALVLAGLFGTMLFFAFELTDPELLSGSLNTLMPGLKGALASTLSGILGSITIGWFANRIDALLDGLILETEAFVGGPFLVSAAERNVRREVYNETELWEALRQEVASMSERSASSINQMADDVHAHAASLQVLSDQIASLPQIRVPPQLAKLEKSVMQFHDSATLLHKTVTPLLETVASLGVFAPAKMLEQLDALSNSTNAAQQSMRSSLDRIEAVSLSSRDDLGRATASLESVPEIVHSKLSTIEGSIDTLLDGAQSKDILKAVAELRHEISQLPAELLPSSVRIHESALALEAVAPVIAKGSDTFASQINGLARLTEQMSSLRERMSLAFDALQPLQDWHKRANRAPLMKLLLLPFWRRTGTS